MSRRVYSPMLAKVAEKAFTDKDWIFEVKWDGFRAISYVGQTLSVKSRNGKELKYNFPELAELTALAKNLVVDGEIVVMNQGKPDFKPCWNAVKRFRPTKLKGEQRKLLPRMLSSTFWKKTNNLSQNCR